MVMIQQILFRLKLFCHICLDIMDGSLLIPFVFPNLTWKKSACVAIVSGLTIEIMQVILHVGIFDIDDVILNALGFMIGYWIFIIHARCIRLK